MIIICMEENKDDSVPMSQGSEGESVMMCQSLDSGKPITVTQLKPQMWGSGKSGTPSSPSHSHYVKKSDKPAFTMSSLSQQNDEESDCSTNSRETCSEYCSVGDSMSGSRGSSFSQNGEAHNRVDSTKSSQKKKRSSVSMLLDKLKKKKKKRGDSAKYVDYETVENNKNATLFDVDETEILLKYESDDYAVFPLSPPIHLLKLLTIKNYDELNTFYEQSRLTGMFFDSWSSQIVPVEKWTMKYSDGWQLGSLIPEEVIKKGYDIEIGRGSCTHETDLHLYFFVDVTSDFKFFERCIAGKQGTEHYITKEGPIALSVLPPDSYGYRKAFVMNKKGYKRFLLPASCTKFKELKFVFGDVPKSGITKVPDTNIDTFDKEMIRYESMAVINHYKFGVLYISSYQKDENEMFSNIESCPAFEKFMKLMGDKVELNGFDKYRGGLDVKNGSTGQYSYYTKYWEYEIMFHVSTLLPNQPDDLQRVEKKRHIGNDIVVILFKENSEDSGDKFDPTCLTSEFNHIFIVIRPDKNDETNDGYTVNVGCKSSVNPFPPFMASNHYKHDEVFREFILKKAINGERTAMFSTAFEGNSIKLRKDQLNMLYDQVSKKK